MLIRQKHIAAGADVSSQNGGGYGDSHWGRQGNGRGHYAWATRTGNFASAPELHFSIHPDFQTTIYLARCAPLLTWRCAC